MSFPETPPPDPPLNLPLIHCFVDETTFALKSVDRQDCSDRANYRINDRSRKTDPTFSNSPISILGKDIEQDVSNSVQKVNDGFEQLQGSVRRLQKYIDALKSDYSDKLRVEKSDFIQKLKAKDTELEKIVEEKNEELRRCYENIDYLKRLAERPSNKPVNIETRTNMFNQTEDNQFNTSFNNSSVSNYANIMRDNAYQQANECNKHASDTTDLEQVANEIQEIINQVAGIHPMENTVNKMAVAAQAIRQIEGNWPLKARIISAIKTGGVEAIAQFLNHPVSSFIIAAFQDWQETAEQ